MNNLIIKNLWEDEHCMQLQIEAISNSIIVIQEIYADLPTFLEFESKIKSYSINFNKDFSFVFGSKEEYILLKFYPKNAYGHIKIDISINNENHNCNFSIFSFISEVDNFLMDLNSFDTNTIASLNLKDSHFKL